MVIGVASGSVHSPGPPKGDSSQEHDSGDYISTPSQSISVWEATDMETITLHITWCRLLLSANNQIESN